MVTWWPLPVYCGQRFELKNIWRVSLQASKSESLAEARPVSIGRVNDLESETEIDKEGQNRETEKGIKDLAVLQGISNYLNLK